MFYLYDTLLSSILQPSNAIFVSNREAVVLGFTDFSENDVNDIIENLGEKYQGPAYHLVKK